jgi:hypothetical protein
MPVLSSAKQRYSRSKRLGDRLEVVHVGGDDSEATLMSSRDDVNVDHVGRT